jgi:spore coat protein U-like protein
MKDGVTMKRFLSRVVVAAALALVADRALAQTAQLNINAQVNASCKVTTSGASATVNLSYDPISQTGGSQSALFAVKCTKGLNVWVGADAGKNGAGGAYSRSVKSGTLPVLGYKLSATAGGTELAIDGTAVDSGVATAGRSLDVSVPVFVALDTNQDPAVGTYSDTVVLTFTAQ